MGERGRKETASAGVLTWERLKKKAMDKMESEGERKSDEGKNVIEIKEAH